jgi:hypothetical protein
MSGRSPAVGKAVARTDVSGAWCGRSWEGLIDRRCKAFAQAIALQSATDGDSHEVVGAFLEFFHTTGVDLMRDEEEWIFSSLRPVPQVVLDALEEHIAISSLIQGLLSEVQAGRVDLRMVQRLGALIQTHLLMEEEEIRPLVTRSPRLTLAR